jgi:hypothetical protein
MVLFAYVTRAFPWDRNVFETPIPYAILVLCFLGVTPAYLLLQRWAGLRLLRFVGVALLLGLLMFGWVGMRWNWHPVFLTGPGPLWCFGFPLVGALAYWAALRGLAPELKE